MKLAFRTVLFQFTCIIVFALTYYFLRDYLRSKSRDSNPFSLIECFFLSVTIQAGVGITDIYPISYHTQIVMIIQQLIMLTSGIFTIYFFTL
jgi:hypothetical protein